MGFRPAGRQRDHRLHHQPGLPGSKAGRWVPPSGLGGVHRHLLHGPRVGTFGATPRFPAPPTTSSGYRRASPWPSSCGEKSRLGECNIHYASRADAEVARDKLAYLKETGLDSVPFESIKPDAKNNWLNQSNSNFERLIPLADRQTKLAKSVAEEQAIFRLNSLGIATNRDEWVYEFDVPGLREKVLFFADAYNGFLDVDDKSYPTLIKWSRDLRNEFNRGRRIVLQRRAPGSVAVSAFRRKAPFCKLHDERCAYKKPL